MNGLAFIGGKMQVFLKLSILQTRMHAAVDTYFTSLKQSERNRKGFSFDFTLKSGETGLMVSETAIQMNAF